MSILLPSWKYNFVHKTWVNFVPELIPIILFPANTIKFITYNVWFEQFNFKERMEELNEIFEKSDADFICLQVIFFI